MRFTSMMWSALVLVVVSMLSAADAAAACRIVGTQIQCDVGANQMLLGTQASGAPATLQGSDRPATDHSPASKPRPDDDDDFDE
jgi:hypothetical protein